MRKPTTVHVEDASGGMFFIYRVTSTRRDGSESSYHTTDYKLAEAREASDEAIGYTNVEIKTILVWSK